MTQFNPQTTDPTQREELTQSPLNLVLHRLALSLAVSLAIACQAQVPLSKNSATLPAQPSPTGSQLVKGRSETSSQTVYRSDRFGFTFQYPDGFVAEESVEPPSHAASQPIAVVDLWSRADAETLPSFQNQGTELPPNITISVHPNPSQRALQDWIDGNNWFVAPTDLRTVRVAGERAIAFQSTGLYEFEQVALPTPDGQYIVLISLAWGSEGYPAAFQQIVSTFQFTAHPAL
jgi:hypothetical protein